MPRNRNLSFISLGIALAIDMYVDSCRAIELASQFHPLIDLAETALQQTYI